MREQRGLFNVCIRAIMTVVSSLSTVIGYYLFVYIRGIVFAFEAIKSRGSVSSLNTGASSLLPSPRVRFATGRHNEEAMIVRRVRVHLSCRGILVGGVKSSTFAADEGNLNVHSLRRVMLHRSSASVQG